MAEDDSPSAALKQIEKEIADLLSKRDKLLRCIRGAPSPALPLDVLLEVFYHLLDDSDDSKTIIYPSHVSRLWRETAIGNPRLWTQILIGASQEGKDAATVAYAATCAQRAGGRLMSLTMAIRTTWPKSPSKDLLSSILEVTRSCRWEKICLSSTFTSDFEHLFGGCLDSEKVAEVHTFSLTNRDSEEHSKAGIIDLQPYRALTSFTFDCRGQKNTDSDIFAVPWQKLTYLKLVTAMDTEQYLHILRQCVNLEVCVLKDESQTDAAHLAPVHLLKLKRLELLATPDIIFNIRAPVIEELVLYSNSDDDGQEELWDYLSSIGSTLRKIELPGDMVWQFSEFVDSWEVLEELTVFGSLQGERDEYKGRERTHSDGVEHLLDNILYALPRLRTLELNNQCCADDYTQAHLLQFMEKHIKRGNLSSLERVTYRLSTYKRKKIEDLATCFERLRKDGIITVEIER
ncbi:hypothetical protein NLJ89_g7413 [Agrocybe chaxingu]|uniref:F-box domain-containing protein n=1 Tax=Agrocybe chaxingu TaxID=84603 RepID=A0A9W8JUM0_9AGAR|nr:hypothetical protein NLJ89_g7413 [Agrocybe chaxingu]